MPEILDFNPLRTKAKEMAFDFSEVNPGKAKESALTSKAGEFEMPVMDRYEALHSKKEEKKEESKNFKLFQAAVHSANGFNIATSAFAAFANSIFKNKSSLDKVQKTASFGAKFSMGVNSIFNIYNGHKQKDIANVVGYTGELLDAWFAPYNVLGLFRGLTFSTYQIPNILTSTGPIAESKTYAENFAMLKDRIPKQIKKILDPQTYSNLGENLGTIIGTWGGLLSGTGVFTWLFTGSAKLGSLIKGGGEILVDLFQVLPKEHRECKRTFYTMSGLSFIIGSLAEIISKQKNNDPVTMALYFFGSGIGRFLYTISNILGEKNYGPGGVK